MRTDENSIFAIQQTLNAITETQDALGLMGALETAYAARDLWIELTGTIDNGDPEMLALQQRIAQTIVRLVQSLASSVQRDAEAAQLAFRETASRLRTTDLGGEEQARLFDPFQSERRNRTGRG